MSALKIRLVIAGMTVVTIVTRSLFLIVSDRMTLPTRVQYALCFASAVALVAIVLPDLLWNQGHFDASRIDPRLVAGIAATVFYIVTRRILGMIFVGMGAFTMLYLWG